MVGVRFYFVILLLTNCAISTSIVEINNALNGVIDFALEHPAEINFDGILGFVIAEAQFLSTPKTRLTLHLVRKIQELRKKVVPNLPTTPLKLPFLGSYLLRPENWILNSAFIRNNLQNLDIYSNWTRDYILEDRVASYKGVTSDKCLLEILAENCYIGDFCKDMMLSNRIDRGYLLSHRLLYLDVVKMKKCNYNPVTLSKYAHDFCSLMLKEARTNEKLGFPAHDIFLEQIVLCGLEGFVEFFNDSWLYKIISWQTSKGCFRSNEEGLTKRTSNIISYGCSDHTTGLAAAALALNLRYKLL